jgi:hypothetical protein
MTKLLESSIPFSAIIFSTIVVLIWSFIPVIGYWLAKVFKANGKAGNLTLYAFGLCVGLIENSLFYFDFLTQKQMSWGILIAFALFFICGYISINNTKHQDGDIKSS